MIKQKNSTTKNNSKKNCHCKEIYIAKSNYNLLRELIIMCIV